MGALRVLLALAVVLSHVPRIPTLILDGHSAVKVFFTVSGFYMFLILDRAYPNAPGAFYLNRALRIWPPYIVTAAASFAVCWWLMPGPITAYLQYGPLVRASQWLTQGMLVGLDAMGFLVSLDGETLSLTPHAAHFPRNLVTLALVPQAWTLAMELEFYLLAPFLARMGTARLALCTAATFLFREYMLYGQNMNHDYWTTRFFPFEFGTFMLGALAYRAYRAGYALPARLSVVLAGVVVFGLWPLGLFAEIRWLLAAGLTALALPGLFALTKSLRWDRTLGEFSYPLYLVHMIPVFVLTGTAVWGQAPWARAAFIVSMSLALAALLYACVAEPLETLRGRIRRRAEKPQQPAAGPTGRG